jgi:DNA-directed RNA polymerase subunit RPC12/RpoP
MKLYYCWKCEKEMPFLEEDEWLQIEPLLRKAAEEIKAYRATHQCNLAIARENLEPEATKMFELLTGMPKVHFDIIYHHRLSEWGPECKNCNTLLRSKNASYCTKCGLSIAK